MLLALPVLIGKLAIARAALALIETLSAKMRILPRPGVSRRSVPAGAVIGILGATSSWALTMPSLVHTADQPFRGKPCCCWSFALLAQRRVLT